MSHIPQWLEHVHNKRDFNWKMALTRCPSWYHQRLIIWVSARVRQTNVCWVLVHWLNLSATAAATVDVNKKEKWQKWTSQWIAPTYCALFKFRVHRVEVQWRQVHQVKSLIDVVKMSLDVRELCVKVDRSLKLYVLDHHIGKMSLHTHTHTHIHTHTHTYVENFTMKLQGGLES